jgi:microcystin-dependent protein
MAYNITLTNGTELIAGGLLDNTSDNSSTSITLVGKNFKSYGLFLNQNVVRLMENFANSTAPTAPLPGQLWFNSTTKLLNVNIASLKGTANAVWKNLAAMSVSASTPTNQFVGEQWYDTVNGQLKIFTGTEWKIIGPINKASTGNSGVIPDVISDSPATTSYVVLKFLIDDTLVGIWSKDGPFTSAVTGFSSIRKGLNLHSSLGHTFWGNSQVASNLYYNGVSLSGNTFVRNDISNTINGSLNLTDDSGITFGSANDFVGSISAGTVTLKNQTNNKDFILSLKTGGVQTAFLRGNSVTGLTEVYSHPVASSAPLTVATKNYVDILSGSVNGTANFFGHVTPSADSTYTLGNSANRWSSIFADDSQIAVLNATSIFATSSNVSQIYLGSDVIPTSNISSNLGSLGVFFDTLHSRNLKISNNIQAGANISVNNLNVGGISTVGGNFNVAGNTNITASTVSVSTSSGALVVNGGVGIAGNINVGGIITTTTLPATTSNTAVATTAFVQSLVLPAGSLMMWAANAAPTGWLICNGAAVSRASYAALFATIGTSFGVGDNSTTFNLPNLVNRVPVGSSGLYALGITGGSKDAIIPNHTHTLSGGSVSGTFVTGVSFSTSPYFESGFGQTGVVGVSTSTGSPSYSNPTVGNPTGGQSVTDANMPPYLAINYIIKT